MNKKEFIKSNPEVTHEGVLGGFVPVYCNDDGTFIMVRWWWAEYLLDVVDFMVKYMNTTPKLIFTGVVER